jgi:hypothetical protein
MAVLAHDARSDECGQLGSRAAFVVRGTEVEDRGPLTAKAWALCYLDVRWR